MSEVENSTESRVNMRSSTSTVQQYIEWMISIQYFIQNEITNHRLIDSVMILVTTFVFPRNCCTEYLRFAKAIGLRNNTEGSICTPRPSPL